MWAAAPGSDGLWALDTRLKLSRSLSLICIHMYICAGTAPRDVGLCFGFSPGAIVDHKHESLILAQNERWRHA